MTLKPLDLGFDRRSLSSECSALGNELASSIIDQALDVLPFSDNLAVVICRCNGVSLERLEFTFPFLDLSEILWLNEVLAPTVYNDLQVTLEALWELEAEQGSDSFLDSLGCLFTRRELSYLLTDIDALDWFEAREEGLGDLYEGLLEKNANEKKSGAGQYFTPRALIDCMVELVQPQPGEIVSDPAAGTAGFLTRAKAYVEDHNDVYELSEADFEFHRTKAFYGVELVPDTRRLALMSTMLHDMACEIHLGDSLSPLGAGLPKSDVILTNPPFGTKKGGGKPTRDDFTFPTSNKQLAFLQHIYRNLKPGGRAAVVLPDNVLFEDNVGQQIRADLMDKCRLHTILRLPTGIFYAQGVKTNVLFFERGDKDKGNTEAVWVYDLRTNMPSFGKRTPFTRDSLEPFVDAFGGERDGSGERTDEGEEGRFRCFSRDAIRERGDNLDITWLRDESAGRVEDLAEPEVIAAEIMGHLQTAMDEMSALMEVLHGDANG